MAYTVFISYRRKSSSDLAQLIYDRLRSDNFNPFYDVEEMQSGGFNTQLYDRIDECSAVIVLLAKGALDERPEDAEDWMRLELAHAFKRSKKVIPIFASDFEFPRELPDDIVQIRYCQGITLHEGYFDAAYLKLKKLLNDHATEPAQNIKIPSNGVCAVTGAFAGAVLGLIGRSISPDAPLLLSGAGMHTLFVLALFGGVFGLAADMLIELISIRANQAVLITVGVILTLAAVLMTGLIPVTVLQILTAAGCAAIMLKKLISK